MRVLVTGASGFIGRRIVNSIERRGWSAAGTSRTQVEGHTAVDVADRSSFICLNEVGPFDAVVHCAAIAHRNRGITDDEYDRVNVQGTRNVAGVTAEIGAKHLILLSSVMVYGRHGIDIKETEECSPHDAYAASKLNSEDAAIEACGSAGVGLTIFRPAPVIGEGCKGNFVRLIRAVDRGRFINVGDGSNLKSMVYVGDVADAVVQVLGSRPTGVEKFNLAGGAVTTSELLEAVYESLGKKPLSIRVPAKPLIAVAQTLVNITSSRSVRSTAKSLETWTSDDVYSTDAIKARYGFEASTPIREAIRRTVASYISEMSV